MSVDTFFDEKNFLQRLRIPIRCQNNNVGFLTIVTFTPEHDTKLRSPLKSSGQSHGHRRSQSLPPKLGVKLFVPPHLKLPLMFTNPSVSSSEPVYLDN